MLSSLLIVISALVSWSVLLVLSRIILLSFALDPWLFTFIQMMAGGAFLIVISGRPRGVFSVLQQPITWIYGVLRVATAAFFTAALLYTTAANAAFLAILSVPTSVLVLWGVMARAPKVWELPGHILILIGLVALALSLEGGFRNPAVIFMILSELCVVFSTLIAEVHPMNQTEDRKQRSALTGAMLLASAFVMLVVALGIGALAQIGLPLAGVSPGAVAWINDPLIVLDPTLWISAVLVGILLRGPSMFLALTAIYRVKTSNYLAAMAALPVTSLALEYFAVKSDLLESSPIVTWSTAFGLVMVVGSLMVLWVGMRVVTPKG